MDSHKRFAIYVTLLQVCGGGGWGGDREGRRPESVPSDLLPDSSVTMLAFISRLCFSDSWILRYPLRCQPSPFATANLLFLCVEARQAASSVSMYGRSVPVKS